MRPASEQPTYLVADLEITNRCNANCSFCPREEASETNGLMEEAVFYQAIDNLHQGGIKEVVFSGFGEAMLHKQFFTFVEYVKQSGLRMSMNTNGSLLNHTNIMKITASSLDKVNISANGSNQKDYEKYMFGLKFDKNIAKIKNLLDTKNRPLVSVQSILRGAEYNEAFKRFYFDLGVDYVQFFTLNNRSGHLYKNKSRDVPMEDKFCFKMIMVGYDGHFYPCSHDIKRTTQLGHVFDHSVNQIAKVEHEICKQCDICSINQFAQMRFANH